MYKAIQPLDYFANQLISCVDILTHLSQWPELVRVGRTENFMKNFESFC
jgi:hypothetical protein